MVISKKNSVTLSSENYIASTTILPSQSGVGGLEVSQENASHSYTHQTKGISQRSTLVTIRNFNSIQVNYAHQIFYL